MKKAILLLFIISVSTLLARANKADLFQLDETAISNEFSVVNELESFLMENEGVTLSELNTNPSLRGALSPEVAALADGMQTMEPPLGIPSFFWGCCLGWVGILITYLITDQDKDETKKALYGCLAQSVCGILVYVVYIVWIVTWVGVY